MTETSIYCELIKILPVIAGGLFTLIAVVVTQKQIHQNTKLRQKELLLQEKSEACVIALMEDYNFLNTRAYNFIEKDDYSILPPIDMYKAEMMQKLYFPELEDNFSAVVIFDVKLRRLLMTSIDKKKLEQT